MSFFPLKLSQFVVQMKFKVGMASSDNCVDCDVRRQWHTVISFMSRLAVLVKQHLPTVTHRLLPTSRRILIRLVL